jgi:hypothetical protein
MQMPLDSKTWRLRASCSDMISPSGSATTTVTPRAPDVLSNGATVTSAADPIDLADSVEDELDSLPTLIANLRYIGSDGDGMSGTM